MPSIAVIVLVIGQAPSDPAAVAFERTLRASLGESAQIDLRAVDADPPDETSAAQAADADGVVEVSWAADGDKARVHCYLTRERRWLDREIAFGPSRASREREAAERGRLLGFAVGTMFAEGAAPPMEVVSTSPAAPAESAPPRVSNAAAVAVAPAAPAEGPAPPVGPAPGRALEFAGLSSIGIAGPASGFGASAALRLAWVGPLWGRVFLAGRAGDLKAAQATTVTAWGGVGLALQALPPSASLELGCRLDIFMSYFQVSHFSDDDPEAARHSRFLPGVDALIEAGVPLSASAGLYGAIGSELVWGQTEVFTHGNRVATVPPFRAIAELGFRTRF